MKKIKLINELNLGLFRDKPGDPSRFKRPRGTLLDPESFKLSGFTMFFRVTLGIFSCKQDCHGKL